MNQNQREYRQVQGGSSNNPRWEPQKQQNFDPNNPPILEGYFREFKPINGGQNGIFMVAIIHTVNQDGSLAQEVDVACSDILEQALTDIDLGSFVCIVYKGKKASKSGGRSYNLWEVYVDDNAIPYQQLGGAVSRHAATNQQQSNSGGNSYNNQGVPNQNNQNYNGGNNQQFQGNQNQGQNNGQGYFSGNNNQGAQNQNFNGGNQQFSGGQNAGSKMNAAPVFNTGNQQGSNTAQNYNGGNNQQFQGNQNQGQNNNAGQRTWNPQNNGNPNTNNQQGGQRSGNQGSGNGAPIFTGNPDNDDLPF